MIESINGLPYLEKAMYAIWILLLLVRLIAGHKACMSFIFGDDDAKTKKEPLKKATERNY